jgi:hypothetical protein
MSNRRKTKVSILFAIVFSAAMSSSAFAQFGQIGGGSPPGPARPVFPSFCPSIVPKLQCLNSCLVGYTNCKTRHQGEPLPDVQICQAAYDSCKQSCNSRIWVGPCDENDRAGQPLRPDPDPLPW